MISITVNNGTIAVDLAEGMRRFNSRLADLHRTLGRTLLEHIQAGFEAERSPSGDPWQPLAKSTVRRRGSAHPMLRVKGRLSRLHLQADATSATVGTNLVYAPIHQFGGEIQRKGGTVKLHFRNTKRGGVRFTRENDRRARYAMKAERGPCTIRIPARPYLFNADGSIPDTWKESLVRVLKRAMEQAHA